MTSTPQSPPVAPTSAPPGSDRARSDEGEAGLSYGQLRSGKPTPGKPTPGESCPGRLLSGPVLLGLAGSLLLATMAVGAGGILIADPLITGGPLSWIRYGHGRDLATAGLYLGLGLVLWAWVRLGRDVLTGLAGARHVLVAAATWTAPLMFSPPLFTRDVYSYLAQGALALRGLDPYQVGPAELPPGPVADNVHYVWRNTPAPYGPVFIVIAKSVSWLTGENAVAGVIGMRLVLLIGLGLLAFALPRLADELGGRPTVALWLVVANPMTVVHLVGGPHNDLLMIGLLAAGTLLVLQRRHVMGIALVTAAMAVKASAAVALPFLVWVWAARLSGAPLARLGKAGVAGVAVFGAVFTGLTVLSGTGLGWIPALDAPSLIVNWMSLPTGAGQLAYFLTSPLHSLDRQPFIDAFRLLGSGIFLAILGWQWWLARAGGTDAVRRAAFVLLCSALLAPATLPWYLTWGLVLGAALPWRPRALAATVAASTWLVLCSYPTGESALQSMPYMIATLALSLVAAAAFLRRDPLHRRSGARSPTGTRQPDPTPVQTT